MSATPIGQQQIDPNQLAALLQQQPADPAALQAQADAAAQQQLMAQMANAGAQQPTDAFAPGGATAPGAAAQPADAFGPTAGAPTDLGGMMPTDNGNAAGLDAPKGNAAGKVLGGTLLTGGVLAAGAALKRGSVNKAIATELKVEAKELTNKFGFFKAMNPMKWFKNSDELAKDFLKAGKETADDAGKAAAEGAGKAATTIVREDADKVIQHKDDLKAAIAKMTATGGDDGAALRAIAGTGRGLSGTSNEVSRYADAAIAAHRLAAGTTDPARKKAAEDILKALQDNLENPQKLSDEFRGQVIRLGALHHLNTGILTPAGGSNLFPALADEPTVALLGHLQNNLTTLARPELEKVVLNGIEPKDASGLAYKLVTDSLANAGAQGGTAQVPLGHAGNNIVGLLRTAGIPSELTRLEAPIVHLNSNVFGPRGASNGTVQRQFLTDFAAALRSGNTEQVRASSDKILLHSHLARLEGMRPTGKAPVGDWDPALVDAHAQAPAGSLMDKTLRQYGEALQKSTERGDFVDNAGNTVSNVATQAARDAERKANAILEAIRNPVFNAPNSTLPGTRRSLEQVLA